MSAAPSYADIKLSQRSTIQPNGLAAQQQGSSMPQSIVAMVDDRIMNEIDAAQYLALSHCTLRSWRVRGGGPVFMRLGSAVRYRRADLEAWLADRRLTSTNAASTFR